MKQYILTRDLITLKAGDVFTLEDERNRYYRSLGDRVAVDKNIVESSPEYFVESDALPFDTLVGIIEFNQSIDLLKEVSDKFHEVLRRF